MAKICDTLGRCDNCKWLKPDAEKGKICTAVPDNAGLVHFLPVNGRTANLVLITSDGRVKPIRKNVQDDLIPGDVILRDELIAAKLWGREDIILRLESRGIGATEEAVNGVIATGCLDALEDCTDEDWAIIDHAIDEWARM